MALISSRFIWFDFLQDKEFKFKEFICC